jgi:hypothetical protein
VGLKKLKTFFNSDFCNHVIGGYGIGIAAEFVGQYRTMNSKQYRTSITGRNGPGGI